MGELGLVHFYGGCLFLGVGYVVLLNLLGQLGADHDTDTSMDGGQDLGLGDPGHLGGHGAGGSHGGSGDVPPQGLSPFSPMMIATFAAAFGSTGLAIWGLLRLLVFVPESVSKLVSFLAAIVLSLVMTSYISILLVKLLTRVQSNTDISNRRLVGVEAEVILEIPPGGSGEVAYILGGGRQTNRAKAVDPAMHISKGATVEITSINESIFWVKPAEPPHE